MSIGQIIAITTLIVTSIVIFFFYKRLSKRNSRATLASLVFMFYAFFLTNVIFNVHVLSALNQTTADILPHIFMFLLVIIGFAFSFFITYHIEDDEHVRRIFFKVAVTIFTICLGYMVFDVTWGFINGQAARLPGHSCNQAAFIFPIIFFMKEGKARRILLAYLCVTSFIGGIATITVPRNILHDSSDILTFTELDTVITHFLLVFIPLIIWVTKNIEMEWIDLPLTAVGLGVQIFIAYLFNLIVLHQIGFAGNWMWLTYDIRPWFPTWLFLLICYIAGAATTLFLIVRGRVYNLHR